MSDILQFSIPGKPEYVQMLRLAVGSAACKNGFDMEQTEDIKVAVEEACNLLTCHGREGFSEKYDLTVKIGDGKLEIIVSDLGSGHIPEKDGGHCKHCPQECDLALFVMDSLMDEAELFNNESGSISIRMVKNK